MADQDPLKGIVQQLIAENASDEDIQSVIQEYRGREAGEKANLSRVLGPKPETTGFKLPSQQYNNPAPSAPKTESGRRLGSRPSDFTDQFAAAMRSKGIEPTESELASNRQLTEGAMSGGLSSASPTQLGVKAAEFAPQLSGAFKGGAERLYGGLLKAKDATINSFPTVVQDLLAAGAPITQGGRAKMINVMKRVGGEKQALLDAADQRAMIPREAVRQGLDESLDTALASSPRPVKDMTTLAKIEKELIPDDPGLLPSHADRIKTTLQTESKRGLTAAKMGQKITDTAATAKMNMAGKLKDALETIEPKLQPVNQAYAAAKGGAQALRDAVKRTSKHNVISLTDVLGGLLGTGVGGPGVGTAAGVGAVRALNNPNIGSRIAIGLDRLGRIPHLDQVTKAALLKLLSETQAPEEPGQGQ